MALGTATVVKKAAGDGPLRVDTLSFAGDGAYSAGGSAAFQAYVRAAVGVGALEILSVSTQNAAGYTLAYDFTADKLLVYLIDADGSDGAMLEDTTADQSARTYVVTVFSR